MERERALSIRKGVIVGGIALVLGFSCLAYYNSESSYELVGMAITESIRGVDLAAVNTIPGWENFQVPITPLEIRERNDKTDPADLATELLTVVGSPELKSGFVLGESLPSSLWTQLNPKFSVSGKSSFVYPHSYKKTRPKDPLPHWQMIRSGVIANVHKVHFHLRKKGDEQGHSTVIGYLVESAVVAFFDAPPSLDKPETTFWKGSEQQSRLKR